MVKDGLWPGLQYQRVPGHEVIGTVDAVGAGVSQWKVGQKRGCRLARAATAAIAMPVATVTSSPGKVVHSRSPASRLTAVMRST